MQRVYEVMFVVRPDVLDEDLDKVVAALAGTVTNGGGAIKSTEMLGRRKLAYTVRKFNDGNYVLFTVEADGKLIAELERRLRVTEPVIKYITVRMDEEQKRLTKVRAIRASRKKLSAQPIAQQPSPAAIAPLPTVPAEIPAGAPEPTAAEIAAPVAEAASAAV